jgi:hypothetical protein
MKIDFTDRAGNADNVDVRLDFHSPTLPGTTGRVFLFDLLRNSLSRFQRLTDC